jgi:ABC-type antimicrobial peptide transport system permease subunit
MMSFVVDALRRDSLRSVLTLIGIFLGLFTAVIILGVGRGIIMDVQSLIMQIGTDQIIVMPFNINKMMHGGAGGAFSAITEFSNADITAIRGLTCVDSVCEMVYKKENIYYGDKEASIMVMGLSEDYFTMYPDYQKVAKGRVFKDTETTSAVLAYAVANTIFSEEILPGKSIIIGNRTFKVVGTLTKVGTSYSQTDDEQIYIPIREAETLFDKQGKRDAAILEVSEGCDLDDTKSQVETLLARRMGVSLENAGFSVITSKFIIDMANQSLNILYLGATSVGLIASLVSAVGIGNTMFTSVFRRKKEIGIMKALGAKRKDIIGIFLLESVTLSVSGAALGAIFGAAVGYALKAVYGLPFEIDAFVVILSIAIGVFVGVVAGILPARSAASIDAIEAMR